MSEINVETLTGELRVGALALGSFDGVHLGHRELLSAAVERSNECGLGAGMLTFSPHPKAYFSPQEYSRIYSFQQNVCIAKSLGISNIFVKSFDEPCSLLSAEDFMELIFEKIKFKTLIIGFDFKLGKNREGDELALLKWCKEKEINLQTILCKENAGIKISSTRIKENLNKGLVEEASSLLGEEYFHMGEAVRDQGLGRQIGFPTINLKLDHDTHILHGVYLTECVVGGAKYKAISNIGFRPTVTSKQDRLVLETHILDSSFNSLANGVKVKIVFKKFVRTEQKFANIEELKAQIGADVDFARSYRN